QTGWSEMFLTTRLRFKRLLCSVFLTHLPVRPRISLVDPRKEPPVQSWFVFSREDASMFAVIKSGGKQYRVTPGQTIRLEKVAGEVGSKVTLSEVLLVDNDGKLSVGAPLVANASIEATVVENDRSKKILVFKKKRKKQYRRTRGHRQDFTAVRIDK